MIVVQCTFADNPKPTVPMIVPSATLKQIDSGDHRPIFCKKLETPVK